MSVGSLYHCVSAENTIIPNNKDEVNTYSVHSLDTEQFANSERAEYNTKYPELNSLPIRNTRVREI